jgi:probable phosphoglycerate mutase
MRRARETCEISGITGLNGSVEVSNDLTEWAYGDYEGLTTAQIQDLKPGWNLWRDGCPGGETAPEVGERCDRIIARLRALGGQSAVFAHGHLLRVLAVRWVGLEAQGGGMFGLDTATLSRLRLDGERGVIQSWNCDPIRSNGLAPYDQA